LNCSRVTTLRGVSVMLAFWRLAFVGWASPFARLISAAGKLNCSHRPSAHWHKDKVCLPLQDVPKIGPAQSLVSATLQWAPTQRPEITKLLRGFSWLCTTPLLDDAALATPQGQCGDLQQCTRSVDLGNLPSPVPTTKSPCQCSGHCYTPGHNYRRGCACNEVLQGSQYCVDCVCSMPGCLKPRYRGKRCHKHGKLVNALPLALRAVEACGAAPMDLMCIDIMMFLESYIARQDLVFALVASMLKAPVALQVFAAGHCRFAGRWELLGRALRQSSRSYCCKVGRTWPC